jgi:putative membrane protein
MHWIKALHVLTVFIWIGTLLSLTRVMGYQVKEDAETQLRIAKICQRMYSLVQLPCMILSIVFGVFLLSSVNFSYNPGWFHMKMTFTMGLVVCDIFCGKAVAQLNKEADTGKGAKYKMLHGVTGLMLIGILVSLFVVRDQKGEIIQSYQKKQVLAENIRAN